MKLKEYHFKTEEIEATLSEFEAKGITDTMRNNADVLVRIPMCGKLESLNASVAAGIMMYELFRQRDIF